MSSLVLGGVRAFLCTCTSLRYTSTWLHAQFLKGCKLSESFRARGPRGVFCLVYPLVHPPSLWGPQLSSSSCDSLGFVEFSCLFSRICRGRSCRSKLRARCSTRGSYAFRGCAESYGAAFWVSSRGESSSQAGIVACAAIAGFGRLVSWLQGSMKIKT